MDLAYYWLFSLLLVGVFVLYKVLCLRIDHVLRYDFILSFPVFRLTSACQYFLIVATEQPMMALQKYIIVKDTCLTFQSLQVFPWATTFCPHWNPINESQYPHSINERTEPSGMSNCIVQVKIVKKCSYLDFRSIIRQQVLTFILVPLIEGRF